MKGLSTSLGIRGRLTTSHSQSRASAETSCGCFTLGQAPPPLRPPGIRGYILRPSPTLSASPLHLWACFPVLFATATENLLLCTHTSSPGQRACQHRSTCRLETLRQPWAKAFGNTALSMKTQVKKG